MKNIVTLFGAILFVSIILIGCGGKEASKTILTLDNVNIIGDSKEYIAIVPGTYELKKSKGTYGDELTMGIKFKVINPYDQDKINDSTSIGNITLQITDGNGIPFDLSFGPSSSSDWDKIRSLLKGNLNDEVTVVFKQGIGEKSSKELIKEILKNGKGIEISRADITNPNTTHNSDSYSNKTPIDNCEQFCSKYEAFADEYVAFMKKYKANPSDLNMIADYAIMIEKASHMKENASKCKGNTKVAARITKAMAKIGNAM